MRVRKAFPVILALTTVLARPAGATFHLMQIEQVIGGVNGSANLQAVQLRMRSSFQNLVSNARLVAHDASGANPVVLIAFSTNVTNSAAGDRVLVATSGFAGELSAALTPDFIFTNPIPASYLAAGSLTYEDDFGTVLWRLSWGGASYTGSGSGALTNDADGNFDPPFAGPLPSATEQALQFQGTASAASTNNAADYALTAGAATFTNNARVSATLSPAAVVSPGADPDGLALLPPTPDPVRGAMAYDVVLPRAGRVQVRVLDLTGRVVNSLIDEVMPAGEHRLTWDPGSAKPASGVYFLELDAGGARAARRFVLIR